MSGNTGEIRLNGSASVNGQLELALERVEPQEFALERVVEGPIKLSAHLDNGDGIIVRMSREDDATLQQCYVTMKETLEGVLEESRFNATFDLSDVPICRYEDDSGVQRTEDLTERLSGNEDLLDAYKALQAAVEKAYPHHSGFSNPRFSPESRGVIDDVFGSESAPRPFQREHSLLKGLPETVGEFSTRFLPVIFKDVTEDDKQKEILSRLAEFEVFDRTLMEKVKKEVNDKQKEVDELQQSGNGSVALEASMRELKRLEALSRRLQLLDRNCVAWALAYYPSSEAERLELTKLLFTVMKDAIGTDHPKVKEHAADTAAMLTENRLEYHNWCHRPEVSVSLKFRDTDEEKMFRCITEGSAFFTYQETTENEGIAGFEREAKAKAEGAKGIASDWRAPEETVAVDTAPSFLSRMQNKARQVKDYAFPKTPENSTLKRVRLFRADVVDSQFQSTGLQES